MGTANEFNLKWNNHLVTLSSLFGEFLNNSALCDVTLSAEGQTISAHRIILAACSSYFQGIFNQISDKTLVIMVKDAKYVDLKSLVDFMYYGEVCVEHDQLNSLLRTAESLKIKGLADEKKRDERIVTDPTPTPQPVQRVPQTQTSGYSAGQKRSLHADGLVNKRPKTMSSAPSPAAPMNYVQTSFSNSPSTPQSAPSTPANASQDNPSVEGGLSSHDGGDNATGDMVTPKDEVLEVEDEEDRDGDGEMKFAPADISEDQFQEMSGDSSLSAPGTSGMDGSGAGMEGAGIEENMEGLEGQDGEFSIDRCIERN